MVIIDKHEEEDRSGETLYRELEQPLEACSPEAKRLVSPVLRYRAMLEYLWGLWEECKGRLVGMGEEDKRRGFALKMEESKVREDIMKLRSRIRGNPRAFSGSTLNDPWIVTFQNQIDYIPGVSLGPRLVDDQTWQQYMNLGQEMKASGNKCYGAKDYPMALTRYSQGVELLHNTASKDETKQRALEELLIAMYTNQAAAALHTSSYRVAVSACDACLRLQPANLKARARRAEAWQYLGDLDAAEKDLEQILAMKEGDVALLPKEEEGGQSVASLLLAAQKDAKKAMSMIAQEREREKRRAKLLLAQGLWEGGSSQPSSSDKNKQQHQHFPLFPSLGGPNTKGAGASASSSTSTTKPPPAPSPRLLSESTALSIQKELMALYSQTKVQQDLVAMRKAADYEEVRFIRRLRPYLIQLVQPLLAKHSLGQGEEGYKYMERAVAQHITTCPEAKQNAKDLVATLMGDLVDMG